MDEFLGVMQSSNHKGIVEGSSANDFKPDDSVRADISTPFNAALTADDTFDKPEPTVVNITERVPVAVQQAMAEGEYVNTRAAPVSLTTQKTVRSCYLYLWHKQKYGLGQAPITELEQHVRWDSDKFLSDLRKAWAVTHLDEVLRDYPSQFVLIKLPPKKEFTDSDPRPRISVSLAKYIDDATEMSAAMDQITGLRILA